MKKIVLTFVALALALMPLSSAGAARHKDPNDSNGLLDMRALGLVYDSGTGVLTLKIRTQQTWGCKFLRSGVKTSLNWYFDDGADGDVDLTGKFVCVEPNKDPQLAFKLHGNDSGNNYELITAKRPNHKTVVVKMPTDLAEFESDHASASARSTDGISEGCDDKCPDRAPDSGGYTIY
jgi:hypothetical protein